MVETFDRTLGRANSPTGDLTGAKVTGTYTDFRAGPLIQTGQPFDLALSEPDQFFTVSGPSGPLYTRNGSFRRTPDGDIVTTTGGYPLLGRDGPLTVPQNSRRVTFTPNGNMTADGQQVGLLQPVRFTDTKQLSNAGPSLFSATPEAGLQQATGQVLQGYRESSNVQPADAMVQMIISSRFYDAAQRSLRAISESIQLNTRPQAG